MDYLQYYKLKEYPFSNVVDNRFYFESPQNRDALLRLRYAIDTKKGLAVVIGEIGTGKTTMARKLLDELSEDLYEAALLVVIHFSVSSEWLLRKFALQLGVHDIRDDKVEFLGQIYRRLLEINESGKTAVLLIDEVQMLKSKEIMEEFRGLLNMEMPGGKMLNLILFGLPDLEEVLRLDEPLRQRVAMKITLRPLSEDNTIEYIKHRLRIAGGSDNLFAEEALREVYKYSRGIPRLINTICDNALLEGFLFKSQNIDASIIRAVAIDLGLTLEGESKSQ